MMILGVDIGGSGIKAALVDEPSGELIGERIRMATPEQAKPEDVADVVAEIVKRFDVSGDVGCGFPAVIRHGVAWTAGNIHESWIGTDVDALFSGKTGLRFHTVNDADAAGLAEMKFGVGREHPGKVIMMVTLGTGIGTALFVDGQLVPNLEFGHLKIRGKDAEWRASDAARKRKELSWKGWSKRLTEYFTELENLFWPDLFVIGGGVSKEADKFLPLIEIRTPMVAARLLNQAGIVGAALYGQQKA